MGMGEGRRATVCLKYTCAISYERARERDTEKERVYECAIVMMVCTTQWCGAPARS